MIWTREGRKQHMPIVTVCQGCGQRLSVPEEHAGQTARCPKCKRVYTVPLAAGTSAPTSDQWRLRTEEGQVYGPVTRAELDQWVAEGRVTAAAQLLREGDPHWYPAGQTYPQLQTAAPPNPFADPQARPPATVANFSPAAAARRFYRPHRGGAILTLGILGVLCCQLLAPFAWVMGQADMRQMQHGVMDPGGRTLTQVGMILGILGTVLMLLWFALQALAVLARAF